MDAHFSFPRVRDSCKLQANDPSHTHTSRKTVKLHNPSAWLGRQCELQASDLGHEAYVPLNSAPADLSRRGRCLVLHGLGKECPSKKNGCLLKLQFIYLRSEGTKARLLPRLAADLSLSLARLCKKEKFMAIQKHQSGIYFVLVPHFRAVMCLFRRW